MVFELIEPDASWDDLALPKSTIDSVRTITEQAVQLPYIEGGRNAGRKARFRCGITALVAAPPVPEKQ